MTKDELKRQRIQVKNKLKSSCSGYLKDLLENVGFTTEERDLFKSCYLEDNSVIMTCLLIHCGINKYNRIHNRILDKIISHFKRNNLA